jgi:hypothetical protein
MTTDDDPPPVQPDDGPDTALLEALAERGEFPVDVSSDGDHAASNGLAVDTPDGRLAFEVYPVEDYGADHERHDPDAGVHVDRWFHDGYTVLHVHDTREDAHSVLVREQYAEERAMELRDHGVPERRAQIVALREQGLTYSEIVDATGDDGPNHRGDVSTHLKRFNVELGNAQWLAENAEPFDVGR